MKLLFALLTLTLTATILRAEDQPIFIYLIDPSDKEAQKAFATDGVSDPATNAPTTSTNNIPSSNTSTNTTKPRSLDDILDGLSKKPPLTKSQERIIKKVTADQMEFIHLMDEFVKADFDKNDDNAKTEFNNIRARIVQLVFDAPTERFFYERIFIINKIYLENSKEMPRFESLDRALRDRSLELEERSRRYRQIITGISAVGGAIGGGFLSFKAAQKILPVVANEKGLSTVVRWAGRGTIVFIGAGVGAVVGAELGFLGSEYLFRRRDFINPIDGDEDLRDILPHIDSLP